MRSKTSTFALAALLSMGASGGWAASPSSSFTGEITRLDTMAKTLVVKDAGQPTREWTFSLANDAKILGGAQVKALSDLKVGERVDVQYSDQGAEHQAHRIKLMATPKVAGKKAAPALKH